MGTGFTIDTPLKVAKYGISSVISLVDDTLIEQMRKFYCQQEHVPYEEIQNNDEDARARRITAYLNLLHKLLEIQVAKLQTSPFTHDSEITRYYEMLPQSPLKQRYLDMLTNENPSTKAQQQDVLRKLAIPGSIDVNIMTKLDRNPPRDGNENLSAEFSDATTALRGYANSKLNSNIVFSAGFNPRLYNYLTACKDFLPDENGELKKQIILKVSDYRSAYIQGKYLAKHGIWVSEFRIESALNCGGHAFVNDGYLMGPILQEFKEKKSELIATLHALYKNAMKTKNQFCPQEPRNVRITAQGGVGTCDEHNFLQQMYKLDAVGWGTPFLLVPEAVSIDDEHLQKLASATEKDVFLSYSSPLGVPFWNLYNSASEIERRQKIDQGIPGSTCPKRFAKTNTEFSKTGICTASRAYQKLKLLSLTKENWTKTQLQIIKEKILAKSCLCHDLAGSATKKYGIDMNAKSAVCPGPNIVNFSKIATLAEMVSHIYGRISLLSNPNRPHMFMKELMIHIDFLKSEVEQSLQGLASRTQENLLEVKETLMKGIDYYQNLAKTIIAEQQECFIATLNRLKSELEAVVIPIPSK
jgi:hypothetical protein